MWKFIILVVSMLLATGCHADECKPEYGTCPEPADESLRDVYVSNNLTSTLTLSPELSDAEIEAVIAAADAWREASGGKIDIQFVATDGAMPERYVVRRAYDGELGKGQLAAYQATHIKIGAQLESNQYFHQSLVHEFGHFVGLGHEPELRDDIMYPYTHEGMPSAPTPDAVSDLKRLYGW